MHKKLAVGILLSVIIAGPVAAGAVVAFKLSAKPNPQAASSELEIGKVYTLGLKADSLYLCVTMRDMDRLTEAVLAKDTIGMQKLEDEGRIYLLKTADQVQILNLRPDLKMAKVRLLTNYARANSNHPRTILEEEQPAGYIPLNII